MTERRGGMSEAMEQAEEMMRRHQATAERAARLRSARQAAEPIVVTSADRMVTVSVDNAGQLVDLRLHHDALRRGDAARLAATILSAATSASQQAAATQLEALQEILGDSVDVTALRSGEIDAGTTVRRLGEQLRQPPR